MAITSPFKKKSHSRDSSREENARSLHRPTSLNSIQKQQAAQLQSHSSQVKKSNTVTSTRSTKSTTSVNSTALSQQFEADRVRLIKYCFSSYDADGVLKDSYISHVRVIEDAAYPFSKPPANSPPKNKKNRVLVLAVKKAGEVFLHKGRENDNGTFQIGRSWSLNELILIARELYSDVGFLVRLGKDYYWETNTPRERHVFITTLVRVYRKFKNSLVPQLLNWDLTIFGLDVESYRTFLNKELEKRPPVDERKKSIQNIVDPKTTTPDTAASTPNKFEPRLPAATSLPPTTPLVPAASLPPTTSLPRSSPAASLPPVTSLPRSSREPAPTLTSNVPTTVNTGSIVIPERRSSNASRRPSDTARRPSDTVRRPLEPVPHTPTSPENFEKRGSITTFQERSVFQDNPEYSKFRRPSNISSEDPLGHSTEVEIEQQTLENEITSKMNELDLNLVPERHDISTIKEDESPTEGLHPINTIASGGVSIKNIEIVAHRKSFIEYEQEQEDEDEAPLQSSNPLQRQLEEDDDDEEDDIADLYQNSEASDAGQYSFNSREQSYEQLTVTPATIKANNQSDDEYDDLNEDVVPEIMDTPRLNVKNNQSPRRRERGNTINSALDSTTLIDTNNNSFDEVFDTIDWDENDDADTLTFKLMKELGDTQYETVKQLIEIKEKSSSLQSYTKSILDECDKIDPLLKYFQIELSGFVNNIQLIENEGRGLQVETINKKNLWNDLQTILETVSVNDQSLRFLLDANIDQNIGNIEGILSDLQSAIVAIRGGDKISGDDDLGDMRALRERRRSYEIVISQFSKKVINELDYKFKLTFQELVKTGDFDELNIRRSLSKLMIYSGLILFTKDISEDSYDELIGIWEGSSNNFLQLILTGLNNNLVHEINKNDKFSLSSLSSFTEEPLRSVRRSIAKEDRLKHRLGLIEDVKSETSTAPAVNDGDIQKPIDFILSSLISLQKHVTLQQDFLLNFFHINKDDLNLLDYIKDLPIGKRRQVLVDSSSINEIETDLESAREVYNSLSMIFQPTLDVFIKNLVQSLRNNQRNTPIVILYLELFEQKFGSSNLEFLLATFKKLSDRLKVDWLRFIDIEVKTIEKTTLAPKKIKEVSIFIKNFTNMIKDIESNYSSTLNQFGGDSSDTSESRELINNSYEQLSRSIIKNLKFQEEDRPSRFNIHDDSEDREKKNYLINLIQNSNWLIESLTSLKLQVLSSTIASARDIFNMSKDLYIESIKYSNFNKVITFVKDVEGLLKESKQVDPSKRNAYSKVTLDKILSGIDTKEINKIVHNVRMDVVGSFDCEKGDIQLQLIEKIWSAIQTQFVSTSVGLETIVQRYYRDVDVKFSKKEIIAAFNAARLN